MSYLRSVRERSAVETLGKPMKQKLLVALLACIGQLLIAQGARAFPDRPVKIVVPTPPGGPPDIMARLLIDKMGAGLGQPVIVENRAGGAAGMIGAKSVLGRRARRLHAADGQHQHVDDCAADLQECRV